jgi:hypothetical protein
MPRYFTTECHGKGGCWRKKKGKIRELNMLLIPLPQQRKQLKDKCARTNFNST